MRILERTDIDALRQALADEVRCDYMYMYPPRQAYRPLVAADLDALVERSVLRDDRLNLYVHVPFCRQICSYCNLYAVASPTDRLHERYTDALLLELDQMAPRLQGKTVRTVYFGGGTPSMLAPHLLARVMKHATDTLGFDVADVAEVAIEVAPDTATTDQLAALRDIGFNRINLGIQTSDPDELAGINRRYDSGVHHNALQTAMAAGFNNVCVDLIFGLEGQTFDSWKQSVEFAIEHDPQTICAYALTLRPGTGFARRGFDTTDDREQYRKWDFADAALRAAGYERQTHVRWAKPGQGGYLQKQYHWASETLVGFGAGARSYLREVDTRNGYSLLKRTSALEQYLGAVETRSSPITDGFVMDDDERMRKALVLGLQHLNIAEFTQQFGADPRSAFTGELEVLEELGVLEITPETIALTDRGVRHRDVVVQPFLSERVRSLVGPFLYVE